MAKLYVKEVKACMDCPNHRINNHTLFCNEAYKYILLGIPEWCPLEDVLYGSGSSKQRGIHNSIPLPKFKEGNMIKKYEVTHGSAVRRLFQFTEGRLRNDNRKLFRPDENNTLSEDVDAYVLIRDGFIAGYWAASLSEPKRSIVIVHPLHRNKGIGTLLIESLCRRYDGNSSVLVGGTNVASVKAALKAGLKLINAGAWDNGKVWLEFKGEV